MKSLRNNRRILGAILLTLVCFVVPAAPAAAFDRGATIDEQIEGRVSRFIRLFDSSLANLLQKLGVTWAADGPHIED